MDLRRRPGVGVSEHPEHGFAWSLGVSPPAFSHFLLYGPAPKSNSQRTCSIFSIVIKTILLLIVYMFEVCVWFVASSFRPSPRSLSIMVASTIIMMVSRARPQPILSLDLVVLEVAVGAVEAEGAVGAVGAVAAVGAAAAAAAAATAAAE